MFIAIKGNHSYPLYSTNEGSFKYVASAHVNELMPAHWSKFSNDIEELKSEFNEIEWRVPTKEDEIEDDTLLIGI